MLCRKQMGLVALGLALLHAAYTFVIPIRYSVRHKLISRVVDEVRPSGSAPVVSTHIHRGAWLKRFAFTFTPLSFSLPVPFRWRTTNPPHFPLTRRRRGAQMSSMCWGSWVSSSTCCSDSRLFPRWEDLSAGESSALFRLVCGLKICPQAHVPGVSVYNQ